MSEYFSGRVSSIVYENSDFYILRVLLDQPKDQTVAVRGGFPTLAIRPGVWLSFEGKWEDHASYGRQIAVTRFPVPPPNWTPDTILSLLSANNVGTTTCSTLRGLGASLHEALLSGPDALISTGLDEFTRLHVIARWKSAVAHIKSTAFLYDVGVPQKVIGRVWSVLGDRAEEVLTSDPWSLLKVDGITFQQADEVASRLGLPLDSPLRAKGAAIFALKQARWEGHLYLTPAELSEAVRNLAPGLGGVSGATLASDLVASHDAVVEEVNGVTAIYDPWLLEIEQFTAKELRNRMGVAVDDELRVRSEIALREWSDTYHVNLTDEQRKAAIHALTEPVSVLTGLPGTGKTTTLRAVVSILKEQGIPFLLCAPTGIAAKRMASVTSASASTVHRAFGAKNPGNSNEREATYVGIVGESQANDNSNGFGERWEYGPENQHPARVVICDESSMLDQHLLYRIVSATSGRLVFVGDAAQLPSVGPGDVLRGMIASSQFPTISLTEIFRQSDTSGIVIAAHDIHKGVVPVSDGKDFVLVEATEEDAASAVILKVAQRLYEARANFQVLSPRHAGSAGVTNLNQRLRSLLNPGNSGLTEVRMGTETVREDDRVMVVKNDYNLDVYNGDVGKVSRIDRKAREIEVLLYNEVPARRVRFTFSDATAKLRLAYAQTIHKSQGQEYDIIVVPVLSSFGLQLQRNLFYTAITRAKKKAILVGTYLAFSRAIANDRSDRRNTLFSLRLSEPQLFDKGGLVAVGNG
jgi:exodeoxyribonuclease V alpha subunit